MSLAQALEHFLPHDWNGRKIRDYMLTINLYHREECFLAPEGLAFGDDWGDFIVACFDETGVYVVNPATRKRTFSNSSVAQFLAFIDSYICLSKKYEMDSLVEKPLDVWQHYVDELNAAFLRIDARAMDGKEAPWFNFMDVVMNYP